jgi:hypothetical protein
VLLRAESGRCTGDLGSAIEDLLKISTGVKIGTSSFIGERDLEGVIFLLALM